MKKNSHVKGHPYKIYKVHNLCCKGGNERILQKSVREQTFDIYQRSVRGKGRAILVEDQIC